MLIKEIKQALIGKVLSYYDGWNGSNDYFKIGYIKGCGSCISVYPEKGKGGCVKKHTFFFTHKAPTFPSRGFVIT